MGLQAVVPVLLLGVLTVCYAKEESLLHVHGETWVDKKDGIESVKANKFHEVLESTPATKITVREEDVAEYIYLEKRQPKDNVEESVSFLVVKDSNNQKRIIPETEVKKNEEERYFLTNNNEVKQQTFEDVIPENVKSYCSSRDDISELKECLLICKFLQILTKKPDECFLLSSYEKGVANKQTSFLSTLSRKSNEDINNKASLIGNRNNKYDDKGEIYSLFDESKKQSSINYPSRISKTFRKSKRNIAERLSSVIGNTSIYGVPFTTHGPSSYAVARDDVYDATARANGLSTDWLKQTATIVYLDGQSRYATFKANFRSGYSGEVTVYF